MDLVHILYCDRYKSKAFSLPEYDWAIVDWDVRKVSSQAKNKHTWCHIYDDVA